MLAWKIKMRSVVWGMVVRIVVEAHPLNLVALLQGLSKLVHAFVGQRTLRLEPHALHLIQVLDCRRPLLKADTSSITLCSQRQTVVSEVSWNHGGPCKCFMEKTWFGLCSVQSWIQEILLHKTAQNVL